MSTALTSTRAARPGLLRNLEKLGLHTMDDITALAIQRGLGYYYSGLVPLKRFPAGLPVSNHQLAVALLSPRRGQEFLHVRLAAALLGDPGADTEAIAVLAEEEGCADMVLYIAKCGHKYEPENSFWKDLMDKLKDAPLPPEEKRLHPTRFIEMTGVVRGKTGFFTRWIRPAATAG